MRRYLKLGAGEPAGRLTLKRLMFLLLYRQLENHVHATGSIVFEANS
jgi:hypothetical protein